VNIWDTTKRLTKVPSNFLLLLPSHVLVAGFFPLSECLASYDNRVFGKIRLFQELLDSNLKRIFSLHNLWGGLPIYHGRTYFTFYRIVFVILIK